MLDKALRRVWAYNTRKIIGRGRSPSPITSRVSYAHDGLQLGLHVFYTIVTQTYAIKSHLTPVYRNHSTIQISVYCKIQLDCLLARH